MIKFTRVVIFLLFSLNGVACKPHDQEYYKEHPQALRKDIAQCPSKSPKLVTCEELENIAKQINQYAYSLRMNPQGYGTTILKLQETIANQANNPELKTEYERNVQELRERLAVVGWLESPGGSS